MRFLGNSEAKTDAKGRVFFPAVFRKQLQTAAEECLILRKDTYQDCLLNSVLNCAVNTAKKLQGLSESYFSRQVLLYRDIVQDKVCRFISHHLPINTQ